MTGTQEIFDKFYTGICQGFSDAGGLDGVAPSSLAALGVDLADFRRFLISRPEYRPVLDWLDSSR